MIIEFKEDGANLSAPLKQAVRAVIVHQGTLWLMRLDSSNTYVLPGGGVNQGERLEDALKREVKEETGHEVNAFESTLIIREYHRNVNREHHIFKTTIGPKTAEPNFTVEEKTLNMTLVKIPLDKAVRLLAENQGTFTYSEPIQDRELLAVLHSIDT